MFITFEGKDGAGKTTIIKRIAEYLKENATGLKVIVTREPGGTGSEIAEDIRKLLLNKDYKERMYPETEMLLMAASRAQHYEKVIKPNRDKPNTIILCDRYFGSSIAYQGYGRDIELIRLAAVNEPFINNPADKCFVFDVSEETSLERLAERSSKSDRLDKESSIFKSKVNTGIDELMYYQDYVGEIELVDANESIDDVFEYVLSSIMEMI